MFERVDGKKWVTGSMVPLSEPTQEQLVEALRDVWQRRKGLGDRSGESIVNQPVEGTVAKVPPFHSKREQDRKVYHDNDKCTEGNNIEKYNRVSGTGNRPQCDHCKRLS